MKKLLVIFLHNLKDIIIICNYAMSCIPKFVEIKVVIYV